MTTVTVKFQTRAAADKARQKLLQDGYEPNALVIHDDVSESSRNDTLDSSAVASAMGKGMELGALAAIPVVGPLLASGPLDQAADETQAHLSPAFANFGRTRGIRMSITTAHPEKVRRDLSKLGAKRA